MNKQLGVIISIMVLVIFLMFLPALGVFFFFRAYTFVGLSLSLMLIGCLQMSIAILRRKGAKRRDQPLSRWWKDYLIIMALALDCWGVLLCLVGLSPHIKLIDNILGSRPGEIFIQLFIALFAILVIYEIVLVVQDMKVQRLNVHKLKRVIENNKQLRTRNKE